jgi:hypothetical protein
MYLDIVHMESQKDHNSILGDFNPPNTLNTIPCRILLLPTLTLPEHILLWTTVILWMCG